MAVSDLLHYHPFKLFFTLAYLSFNAVRLPLWIVLYSIPSNRPHQSWSLGQAVRVRILRAVLYNMSTVEMRTPLSLLPGAEKERFVVVPVAKSTVYTSVLTSDPQVRPEPVGITFYPSAPTASQPVPANATVILHLHGGAYTIGDGRTQDAGFCAKTLLAETEAAYVACPQYRLASNPGCRFPAQLQDAVTSYAHLVGTLGVSPDRVVLSGDSAGANLALALVRYLELHGAEAGLGSPKAALLWSLWAHPAKSWEKGANAMDDAPNGATDYVTGAFGAWGAKMLRPGASAGVGIDSPWISFLGAPFATGVPLYFSTGECEALLHDDVQASEQFAKVEGNTVKLQVEEGCVHDVILTAKIIGFEKEAARCAKRAGEWLKTLT